MTMGLGAFLEAKVNQQNPATLHLAPIVILPPK